MSCPQCGESKQRTVMGPFGPHHAKLVCGGCGRHLKFLPKPAPPRGSRPSPEIVALVHPRQRACPLRGTGPQVRAARAIRNSLLFRIRDTTWIEYRYLIMCITDATWFMANSGKEPDELRWPSPRQMEVSTFQTPCEACGEPAYGGESVCSEECADVLQERAL
jgi:hypothetical protein